MATTFYNLFTLPLFFFLFLLPSAHSSVSFKITRFDPNALNVIYHGDAVPSVGAIEMNKVNYVCRVGWATYAEKVPLWDSNTGNLANFSTHFSFIIDTQGSANYGHGLAFFLAPVGFEIPPNSVGGFLGLYNTTNSDSSKNQLVHVEFDSFANPEWDPTFTHVGINNNSISSAVDTTWNASFHSGDTADVWITYNASTRNLSVSWTYQRTSNTQENTSLSYQIDLRKVLPEWVTVGFSAATGYYGERHTLLSWEFSSSLDINVASGKEAKGHRLIVVLTVTSGVLIAEWEQCVVHRDIKASNVMLDSNFNVKLGDFGLARLMDHELGPQTTGVAGTLGYMAPEYLRTARASKETDVYSFGVVALEIVTGRRSIDPMGKDSEMGLVDWIWNLHGKGDLLLALDEKLQSDFDEKQVKCLMIIGLWCSHPDRNLRPTIREAIQVLKFEAAIPNLPTEMHVPMYRVPTPATISSSEASVSTTSLQHGR
ncbi:l-type lectin-domain containing receptor kinase ix.1 [Quercus suber]|uniref:L-type lectin-domain containing receptor kinase ix.1 n=1 Tax=Quercus suber TaxID=58331 RepID=A0AAW0IVZ5_QUESU